MRYFIQLSYDGAPFGGWQIQENSNSIQGELQRALSMLLRDEITVTGAGRTDAGVNAINYVAHFDSTLLTNEELLSKAPLLIYKLNAILPKEIVVNQIIPVNDELHARFSATSRTYKYYLHTQKDPFCAAYSYYYPFHPLDFTKMNRAAALFLGRQDFSSLQKAHSQTKSSICTVKEAFWSSTDSSHHIFTVTADRFLRNMVRAMVGSLIIVGAGKEEPEWIAGMLEARDRCKAGNSVPGNALFLTNIEYPGDLFR